MANEYDALLLDQEPATGNEYDALLGELRQQDSQALKSALHVAADIDPDRRAQAAQLARQTKLPVDVVERNLELVAKQQRQQATDYDALLTRYSRLSQWLTEDPTNAVLAQDDLDGLQRLHDALTTGQAQPVGSEYDRQSWVARNLANPAKRGLSLLQGGTSMAAAANMLDRMALLDRMEPLLQAGDMQAVMALVPPNDPDPLFNLYWNTYADDPAKRAEVRAKYEQQLAQLLASAGRAAASQQALPQNPRMVAALESGSALEMLRTVVDEPGIIWQVGVESAVASIPGLLAMPLAGPGALGLNSLALEYGNTLMEGIAELGVDITDEAAVLAVLRDPEQRAALQRTAVAKGVPVALFDTVSAGVAGKILAPRMLSGQELSATTRELVNIGAQLPVQATLGAAGEAAGQLLAHGDINGAEVLLEGVAEVFGTGPEILSSRAAQAPLRSRMERLASARRTKAVMQTLGEIAPEVKLGRRDPERLQGLVQQLGAQGGIADILVPVQFWQEHYAAQGVDPREQAIAVLGDALAYDEAVATGADLQIPMGAYVAKIAATPDHQAFINHVRLDPLDPTNADADGWAQALAEGIQEAAGADSALAQSVDRVRQDILGQLEGVMPRDEAEQYAALMAARYRTRGILRGMDPFELYSQHRLRIQAPDTAEPPLADAAQTFEQFAGPQAETADQHALSAAQAYLEAGVDPEQVRQTTGWFRGMDGKWRFEIDDSEARWQPMFQETRTWSRDRGEIVWTDDVRAAFARRREELGVRQLRLRDVLDHPKLFAAYPTLAYAPIQEMPAAEFAAEASFSPRSLLIRVRDDLQANQALSVLLHEIQHAIQYAEGFAVGGSPDRIQRAASQQRDTALQRMQELQQRRAELAANPPADLTPEELQATLADLDAQIDDARSEAIEATGETNPEGAFQAYRRLAGEIEARNTQARQTLTEDERRVLAPEDTQDIPSSEAIVVFNGQEMRSAPPPANTASDVTRRWQKALARMSPSRPNYSPHFDTPVVLRNLGVKERTLELPTRVLTQIVRKHPDVPTEVLRNLPALLAEPRYVFPHHEGGFNLAIDAQTANGEPIIVGVREGRIRTITPLHNGEQATGEERLAARVRDALGRPGKVYARNDEALNEVRASSLRQSRTIPAGPDPRLKASVVTRADLVKQYGAEFYQRQRRAARGSITFGADGVTISLLRDANLSTFLHEAGHLFLEELAEDAAIDGVADTVRQDLATVQAWWQQQAEHIVSLMAPELRAQVEGAGGAELVREVASRWRAPQSPLERRIVTELHEYFARGFEAYLRGEDQQAFAIAPSTELRSVFARFRAWLVALYQTLTDLRVSLTPEVRGVMDRLLATEQEIATAEAEGEIAPLFLDADTAGMSEAEFATYRATVQEASLKAREALQRRLMDQYQREQKQWWREARAAMRERVEKELNARREYRALAWLTTGKEPDGEPLPGGLEPFKLDRAAIVASRGESFLRQLPGPRNPNHRSAYVYARAGGVHPDLAAERLGFANGDELLDTLAALQPKRTVLEAETDARMIEAHGDLRFDGTMAEAAREAVHGAERSRVILAELRALRRKMREVAPFVRAERQRQAQERRAGVEMIREALPSLAVVRQMAEGRIGQIRLRDLKPHRYLQAARRAGRDALQAVARGDWQAAALAKRKELVNTELYLAALRAQQQRDKMVKHLKGLSKPAARTRIGKGGSEYLEQIDALLDRFEFARVPLKELDERQTLLAWYQAQLAAGFEPAIDPALFNEASRRNYQELTLDELTGVYDAARSIEALARRSRQLKAGDKLVEREQVVAELVSQAAEARKRRKPPKEDILKGWLERAGDRLGEFDADLMPVENLIEWLDGGATGPWHDYLFNPASEAQSAELDLHAEVGEKIGQMIDDLLQRDAARMTDTFQSSLRPEQPFSRFAVISLALNLGNESNYDKLIRGFGWQGREAEVLELVGRLDRSDLEFVQQVWDTIETLYAPLNELQKRVAGVPLDKVERRPLTITLRTGEAVELAGGYYPLVYDPRHSTQGLQQESGPLAGLVEEGYARATTPSSHRKGRTRFAAPLLLDFNHVLQKHLAGVIKDLTHREFLIDANWLLQNKEIRTALQDHLGDRYERLFLPWLKGIANDRVASAGDNLTGYDRAIEGARSRVTLVALGWKVTSMLAQFGGVPNVLEYIRAHYGSRYFLDAVNRFARNPREAHQFVLERSGEMRHRFQTIDRDIRDELRRIKAGKVGILQRKIERSAFLGIVWTEKLVSIPAWLAAYRGALAQGATEEQAIHAGDAAVRRTQGAGGAKDLNALQRRRGVMRMLTMFLTPFAAQYGRLRTAGDLVSQRGARYAPEAVLRVALITMLPAVLSELLANRGPECDLDDVACWAKWAAVKSATSVTGTVPVLRDIGNGLEAYALDGSLRDARFSPVLDAINRLTRTAIRAVEAAVEDDWSDDYAWDLFEVSGYALRLPTGQGRITLEYLWDLTTGEAEPEGPGDIIHGLLYRRPRDEQ